MGKKGNAATRQSSRPSAGDRKTSTAKPADSSSSSSSNSAAGAGGSGHGLHGETLRMIQV